MKLINAAEEAKNQIVDSYYNYYDIVSSKPVEVATSGQQNKNVCLQSKEGILAASEKSLNDLKQLLTEIYSPSHAEKVINSIVPLIMDANKQANNG